MFWYREVSMFWLRARAELRRFATLLAMWCGVIAVVAATAQAAENVVLSTDFGYNGRQSYFFVALEKGYFKDEGLDVKILSGRGSATVIKEVGAGTVEIGFADAGTLILARGNEAVPVKMVAMVYVDSPLALITLEKSGIKSPKDLVGKLYADASGSATSMFFTAYAKASGIDPNSVRRIAAESTSLVGLLLNGKADVVGQFSVWAPLFAKRAAPNKIKVLLYKDAPGFGVYSNGFIVGEAYLKAKPDTVRAVVKALQRGMRDAFADPAEAGRILAKHHPQVEADIGQGETEMVRDIATDEFTKKHGLGYIDQAKMKATVDMVASVFNLKNPVKPEDVYAPGFISPIFPK